MDRYANPYGFNYLVSWNSFFALHRSGYYDFLIGLYNTHTGILLHNRNTISLWESIVVKLSGLLSCWYHPTLSTSYIQTYFTTLLENYRVLLYLTFSFVYCKHLRVAWENFHNPCTNTDTVLLVKAHISFRLPSCLHLMSFFCSTVPSRVPHHI